MNEKEKRKLIDEIIRLKAEANLKCLITNGKDSEVNLLALVDFISAMPEESDLKTCPVCNLQWYMGTGEKEGLSLPMLDGHIVISPLDDNSIKEHLSQIVIGKIEEAMKAKGYDNPAQMPVKEVLDYLDQDGE